MSDIPLAIFASIAVGFLIGGWGLLDKSSRAQSWRMVCVIAVIGFIIQLFLIRSHQEPYTGDLEDPDFCTVNVC